MDYNLQSCKGHPRGPYTDTISFTGKKVQDISRHKDEEWKWHFKNMLQARRKQNPERRSWRSKGTNNPAYKSK